MKDIALNLLQTLVNASGAKFEDGEIALACIEETLKTTSLEGAIHSVQKFMEASGQTVNHTPSLLSEKDSLLRYELMGEEAEETMIANDKSDLVEVLDGCGDMIYIAFGTIVSHGLQNIIREAFKRINDSNMTKVVDGKVLRREDGKILKPDTYKPVDLTDLV